MKTLFDQIMWICDVQNDITMGGGKGSGSSTNTTTTTEQPPAQLLQAYQTATNAAQSAASQPLQQYNGSLVAGFTPDQTSAMSNIDSLQGVSQPYINQAQGLINNSTQNLWGNTQQFSPSTIQNYTNPYTQNVLGTTEAAEQNQDAQQQAALQGNAISSGAWGGDRAGVASAVLSGQQAIANNATNANIENTGYNTGLQEFNTEQQAQLGANEANQYLDAQGAYGEGNLGNEALSTGLTGATAQLQSGTLQQQLGQEELDVPYEQFEAQQAYPFQTAQYFANIAEGLGSGEGGTSSTTTPAASQTSQILGGGILGAGALGSFFGGSNSKRGGAVNGYADGGVPDVSVDFIPTTTPGSGRNTIPNPPNVGNQQTSSLSSDMQNGQALGKGLGVLSNLFNNNSSSGGMNPSAANIFNNNTGGSFGDDTSLANSGLDSSGNNVSGFLGPSTGGDITYTGGDSTNLFSSLDFYRGGRTKPYAIGGEVLPDVISGVGDIVGAFFGDPAAGDQGVGILSNLDGGATKGAGVETQLLGMAEGKNDSQTEDDATGSSGMGLNALFNPSETNAEGDFTSGIGQETGNGAGLAASYFNKGGLTRPRHLDTGGDAGGLTPLSASSSVASPQQQTQASTYQGMTPEQLQTVILRLPAGSSQQRTATAVLQQKRMMPNTGVAAQNGFTGQSTVQSAPQAQQPMYGGYARGGLTPRHLDDGGNSGIPNPPSEPELEQELENEGNGSSSGSGLGAPSPTPAAASVSAPDATAGNRRADPWQAIMAAGAGMMAGQSPQAGVNIGQGALAGLKNYTEQQKESDEANNQTGTLSAKNRELTQQGQYQTQELGIRQEEAQAKAKEMAAEADRWTAMIKQNADKGWTIEKDGMGNLIRVNKSTGEYQPVNMMGTGSNLPNLNGVEVNNSSSSNSSDSSLGGANPVQSGFPVPSYVNDPIVYKKMADADEKRISAYQNNRPVAENMLKELDAMEAKYPAYYSSISSPSGVASYARKGEAFFGIGGDDLAQAKADIDKGSNSLVTDTGKFQYVPGGRGSVFALRTIAASKPGVDQPQTTNLNIGAETRAKIYDYLTNEELAQAYRMSPNTPHVADSNVDNLDSALKKMYPLLTKDANGDVNFNQQNVDKIRAAIPDALKNPQKYLSAANSGSAPVKTPSQKDISYLQKNPQAASKFDATFGTGASRQYLGQQ